MTVQTWSPHPILPLCNAQGVFLAYGLLAAWTFHLGLSIVSNPNQWEQPRLSLGLLFYAHDCIYKRKWRFGSLSHFNTLKTFAWMTYSFSSRDTENKPEPWHHLFGSWNFFWETIKTRDDSDIFVGRGGWWSNVKCTMEKLVWGAWKMGTGMRVRCSVDEFGRMRI